MTIELKMPALSPTMETGRLSRWLVCEGDLVRPGDVLAEIETDKATMELEAADEGRVARLLVASGTDDVAVGTVIALISAGEGAQPEAQTYEVSQQCEAPDASLDDATPHGVPSLPQATIGPPSALRLTADVEISPLARAIARAKDIELGAIAGSGADGRIMYADLGVGCGVSACLPITSLLSERCSKPEGTLSPPLSGLALDRKQPHLMRETGVQPLARGTPGGRPFHLKARCKLDKLLGLRREVNGDLATTGVEISANVMLIKAMALALTEVPQADCPGKDVSRHCPANIATMIAVGNRVVAPVLRDVGTLSLAVIAQRATELFDKAGSDRLSPEDCIGGTASLWNFDAFGIDEVIPASSAAYPVVLGISAGIEQPWRGDGTIDLATIMTATGSFDPDVTAPFVAARFMSAFRSLVETPLLILS